MTKDELRNRFLKEIPKQIISGEQLSYADWLEQLITSGELVKDEKSHIEQSESFVCPHPPKQTFLIDGIWHCQNCGGKWRSLTL